MPHRRSAAPAAIVLTLLATLVAAPALLGVGRGEGADDGAGAPANRSPVPVPTRTPTPTPTGAGAGAGEPAGTAETAGGSGAPGPRGAPSPAAVTTRGVAEVPSVLAEGAAGSTLLRLAPPRATAGREAGAPPVAPRSVVRSRSRSGGGAGERVQVTLVARGAGAPQQVLRFYRVRLGGLGWVQRRVAAVAGSSAAAFRRGADSVVVTATGRRGGGSDYSVLATWGA